MSINRDINTTNSLDSVARALIQTRRRLTKLEHQEIQGMKIVEVSMPADRIETHSITATQIKAGSITATELEAGTITAEKIKAGTITATLLAANSVTAEKIAANAVEAGKIKAEAVTAEKIAAGSITAGKIAANAVEAVAIKANAVTTEKLNAGAVTTEKLNAGAVTAVKIEAHTITATQIAAATITSTEIASATITGSNIAGATITASKISISELSALTANLGTITAGTVTGATVRTAATGKRVTFDSEGIRMYDGSEAIVLNASTVTGNLSLKGKLEEGSVVPAGTITNFALRENWAYNPVAAVNANWWLEHTSGGSTLEERKVERATDWGMKEDGTLGAGGTSIRVYAKHKAGAESGTIGIMTPEKVILCAPGQRVNASCYVKTVDAASATSKSRGYRILVQFQNSAGSTIESVELEEVDEVADGTRLSISGVAPAATVYIRVYYRVNTTAEGDVLDHRYTGMLIEVGASSSEPGTYFPSQPQLEQNLAKFVGTEHESPSLFRPLGLTTSSSLVGKLTDAQLEAIAAAKITGQITETQITNEAITTPKIKAGAIDAAQIAAGAIIAGKIAAGAITAEKLAANSVESAAIAAGTIVSSDIAAGTITATNLAAGAITAEKIASNAVESKHILGETIVAGDIAALTITATQIAASTITAAKLNVSELSAITANLGSITAGTITGATFRTSEGLETVLNSSGLTLKANTLEEAARTITFLRSDDATIAGNIFVTRDETGTKKQNILSLNAFRPGGFGGAGIEIIDSKESITSRINAAAGGLPVTIISTGEKSSFLQLTSTAKNKINFGSGELTFGGGTPEASGTVTHGLGATPVTAILVFEDSGYVPGAKERGETTFKATCQKRDGTSPGAGTKAKFTWIAVG